MRYSLGVYTGRPYVRLCGNKSIIPAKPIVPYMRIMSITSYRKYLIQDENRLVCELLPYAVVNDFVTASN